MPRILFAATHSDCFCEEKKAELTKLFEQQLRSMFSSHNLCDHIVYDKVFFINATNPADQHIDSLKDKLVDIAVHQDTWGEKLPIIWIPLDLKISDMRAEGVNFITKDAILNLNRSNGNFKLTEKQVNDFLLVKHSIGQILYIDEPALRDNIIIQPTAMVNILRAFITDIKFWPEKGNERDILDNLSSTGVLKKTDLFILWSQPAFADILTDENTKDFVVKVLIHLDILVEPKRYNAKEGFGDWFLVPCVVKENIPPEMKNAATDDKTICLAYHLKKTVIPSALSFKLIGASISIWPLKETDKQFCLYFQAAVMDADNNNELQIHVDGQRILVYIIHNDSKQLISPDLVIATRECLTLALERILQFYHCSFGQQSHKKMSDLFEIEVGEICQGGTCLIPLSDAKQKGHWECKNGNKHETLYWCVDKVLREDHTFAEIADNHLQQPPPDDVINKLTDQKLIGNCVVHLGIELGLSINDIIESMDKYHQNVSGQINSILIKWKNCNKKNMVTIYRLMVALKRVRAAEGLQFVMKMYDVEQKDIEEKCHSSLQGNC
ncbi:Hypothetical predicted protein [Mytilus galloprovincialis]|uniref:Death domain-containing protein n=1 Tax=Mytilus galloprovincialis TaxID=29158 RepID=A0A8B6GBG2_MYTGA|nr:Hypothetical predicted protein [Mytilus galloprovincialis]